MTRTSSRHFLADRSAAWNASANREYRPAELLHFLCSAPSHLCRLRTAASHAAARELTYPA
jgi:hypothetical protein